MKDKKLFWNEALKAGTIVGLVSTAFALLMRPLSETEHTFWLKALNMVSWIIIVLLLYAFTRRFSKSQPAAKGFSYGRGIGFVVAAMMFVGVVNALYSSIMANYFIKAEVLEQVDRIMVVYQDMWPDDMFEKTYAVARNAAVNPFYITFSSVLGNCFVGFLLSLVIAAITRREPDIFSEEKDNAPQDL